MPALLATDAAETIANSGLFSRAVDETGDALQVICAWPVSGQYGTGTRVLSVQSLIHWYRTDNYLDTMFSSLRASSRGGRNGL
jgi:hypothetical protein